MRFKDALWDGSDPLYAPGISWSGKNPERKHAVWKCPKKYVKAGYAINSVKIEPVGQVADKYQKARALRCRELSQELVKWFENQDKPRVDPETWKYLIARYQTDEPCRRPPCRSLSPGARTVPRRAAPTRCSPARQRAPPPSPGAAQYSVL